MDRDQPRYPEEPHPDEEELTELLDQLEDAEETVDSSNQRQAIRRTRRFLSHFPNVRRFGFDDIAQQIVGGFILSAPFVVTEEVWTLAASMNLLQTAITIFMVFAIGYGTLYRAEDREAEMERSVAGIPLRFISLLIVSYTSVTILAFVFDAPDAFDATWFTTFKAICIGAIFSVVGAATADSLF